MRREVQTKANDELPEEAEDPFVLEVTTSTGFPTALVVVTGQADDEVLRRQARIAREDIERIDGVDQIISIGERDPELQVRLDPEALAARGLLASDVADGLALAFRDTFAGKAQVAGEEWLVRVDGTTSDPEKLATFQLAPRAAPDQFVALDDVATVARAREDATQLVSYQGRAAAALSVAKVPYTNTIELLDRLEAYISAKNTQLGGQRGPPGAGR